MFVLGGAENVCVKENPFQAWMPGPGSGESRCYEDGSDSDSDDSEDSHLLSGAEFTCVKTGGAEPPEDLTSFMTSLLHERDVTHYHTWTGHLWKLGSGAYADVHLGRLLPHGRCVVVKRFQDFPLYIIEREIGIHRYMEHILPSTPRLLGLLPTDHRFQNASLVYQFVPDSYTLHQWLKLRIGFSTVQWLSVALQLAETMETMHRKCVLHNDFHSSNILLHFQQNGHDYDTDCGISRLENQEDKVTTRMSHSLAKFKATTLPKVTLIDFGHATFRKRKKYRGSKKTLASCHHLAPEVVTTKLTSPASDVYSLGHELLHIASALNSSSLRNVALQCTTPNPEARPPAAGVVHTIRGLFVNEWRRLRSCQDASPANTNGFSCVDLPPAKEESVCEYFHSSNHMSSLLESIHDPNPSFLQRSNSVISDHNFPSLRYKHTAGSCLPHLVERAMSKLTLPYITFTGDLVFETDDGEKFKLLNSTSTSIFIGHFASTEEDVIIKEKKKTEDPFRIRYEAMINAYLNETGWVPKFYGLVPLSKHDFYELGLVQEMFAESVTLEDVLESGKPFGVYARVELAHQLTSLLHDVHSRHMLINNFKSDNILCACVSDSNCSDIKLIDLGETTTCEGKRMNQKESYLRHFSYLSPEVCQNQLTSFPSDVFSLTALLCTEQIGREEAKVICHDLGLPSQHPSMLSRQAPEGSAFVTSRLSCSGHEYKLSDCLHDSCKMASSCSVGKQAAFLSCQAPGEQVTCGSDVMELTFEKAFFPSLHREHLTLSDVSCVATDNATHIILRAPLTACGTVSKQRGGLIIYRNTVHSLEEVVEGVITRVKEVQIPFQCLMDLQEIREVPVNVDTQQLHFLLEGSGRHDVGCPEDSTLVLVNMTQPTQEGFHMEAFKFLHNDHHQVALHCDVMLCDPADTHSLCSALGCHSTSS
ncbi:hypothetical protein ACOMHN_045507 [Nucella lapillus]